jgi:hypothetical protein
MQMSNETNTNSINTGTAIIDETASPARCACGEVVPPPRPTVSHRIVCSPRCQHYRDHVLRRIALRRRHIAGWQQFAAVGNCTPEQAAHEVQLLEQDIAELARLLLPPTVGQVITGNHPITDAADDVISAESVR